MLLTHRHGTYECLESSGLPLAVMEDMPYDELTAELAEGDRLLLFSDAAVETANAAGELLGIDGLMAMLTEQGYPQAEIRMEALEEALLRWSDGIRLADDLTLVDVRLTTA